MPTPDTAELRVCGAWCLAPHFAASVRCLRPEGHDGMHLSDNLNGDRFSWEPVNFDPFAHTGKPTVSDTAATDDPAAFATSIGAPHQVTQTILYDPELNARGVYGNCLQAAFASLLGMPLEAVPHFVAFGSWDTALALWLGDIGLTRIVEERDSIPTTGACLVSGRSVRGVRHTVVAIEGEVWDPHPSRDGLATVDEVWWFEPRRASQEVVNV